MTQANQEVFSGRSHLDMASVPHGSPAERFAGLFWRTDPLADAVIDEFSHMPEGTWRAMLEKALADGIEAVPDAPKSLRELFAQLDHIPFWVDRERCDLGGATFLRCRMSFVALAMFSLPIIYSWPAGSKPLALSGRLVHRASQRLKDTVRYVYAVCQPGGLTRFSEGFAMTVRVRLIHAQVRKLLLQSGHWRPDVWGAPINQCHMAGTNLQFSLGALDALQRIGYRFNAGEREALIHLWRYAGYLMGVESELSVGGESEGHRLLDMIFAFEPEPDDDSRALVTALMHTAYDCIRRFRLGQLCSVNICFGVSRALIGDKRADLLGYPKTAWRWLVPAVRPFTQMIEIARLFSTRVQELAKLAGPKAFRGLMGERGLRGATGQFAIPRSIAVRSDAKETFGRAPFPPVFGANGQRPTEKLNPSNGCMTGGTK
ncbi:MAG TPA: oxygenase MpaB family protein [Candidatus Angelobacter sp.]|nr:oxygenase MpaB family protein [Candidatus Angelobacter sp.]